MDGCGHFLRAGSFNHYYMQGLRYNEGKPRIGLISPFADRELARVLTKGAEKYDANNWKHGMSWLEVCDSLERHLNSWKAGEERDTETGCLHMAHVMCNAMFLTEYYQIAQKYDDRFNPEGVRIGLDIDEVLADWTGAWAKKYGTDPRPTEWDFDPKIKKRLKKSKKKFWMGIKPKDRPGFTPYCYITSRAAKTKWTVRWLRDNGFPDAPVYTTYDKVATVKSLNLDIFVDDAPHHFKALTEAGIKTYLYDCPHNRHIKTGMRIKSLKEI